VTFPDLIYVAAFAFVGPFLDYATFWQAQRRLSQSDPAWARQWTWKTAIGHGWLLVGLGAAIWIAQGRSWASFGFVVPEGWRLWTAIAVVLLAAAYYVLGALTVAGNSETRAKVRQQCEPLSAVLPQSRSELTWFAGVSLTAGFCEEFLFRGYFIWALAPWLGWWGAAALSLGIFALGHVYQGWNGVLRTAIFGAGFTILVAVFDSLWPAIALHVMVDLSGGVMAWLALRDRHDDDSTEQHQQA
jgi:membrane protease YdiL (CAAX protease family)